MGVTRLHIEGRGATSNEAGMDYYNQLAEALSPYGFTVSVVDVNLFYIAANIPGLDTIYYTFRYGDSSYYNDKYMYVRKTVPTKNNYSSYTQDIVLGSYSITSLNYTKDGNSYTYIVSGNLYIIQNSNGDIFINLSNYSYSSATLPTYYWFGITTLVTPQGEIKGYYLLGGVYNRFFLPKDGKAGYFEYQGNSNPFVTEGETAAIIRNPFLMDVTASNYTGGLFCYPKSFYDSRTTIPIVDGNIYIINGEQYLLIGNRSFIKL